jgi:AGCS family alanine or glycine:cation symporter
MSGSKAEKLVIWIYRFLILGTVVFGAVKEADTIWKMGDIGVGLMAWINVIALLLLCPHALRALKEYESSLKHK